MKRSVIVAGASSGIGKAISQYLFTIGYDVIGVSRTVKEEKYFSSFYPLDITNERQIDSFVQYLSKKDVAPYAVINCVGYSYYASVLNAKKDDIRHQYDVNVLGPIFLFQGISRLLVPNGFIIHISSIAGYIALPFQGYYSSAKFAMEGLLETMRYELESINVVLVEPGDIKSEFSINRKIFIDTNKKYQMEKSLALYEKDEANGASPLLVAKLVSKILKMKNPKLRYRVGNWSQILASHLKFWLPQKVFEKIMKTLYM